MALLIEDRKTEEVVEELAAATGEPKEVSIAIAVKERLDRVTRRKGREMLDRIREFQDRIASLPELDPRPEDEILGYNEHGLFD